MKTFDPNGPAQRWLSAAPFVILGSIGIVAAGLTSAATAFAPSYQASWAVAYLVLVVGAAQIALGLGQAWLAPKPPSGRVVALESLAFNLGHAAILIGTLLGPLLLTVVGSALVVAVLILMYWLVRSPSRRGWLLYAYWLILAILLVSIPIGLLIRLT